MAYTNPRGQAVADIGALVVTLCACTLADYAASGSTTPVVGDLVTFSTTGNWYVARAPDNTTKLLGRVTRIELAPVSTAVGYIDVEWLDVERFVQFATGDLSTHTRGNAIIKNGDTSVASEVDSGSTTGVIKCVAKSGTSGAGTVVGAVSSIS